MLLGVALGANVVMVAWIFNASLATPTVEGQTVNGNGNFVMATGRLMGRGEADALYVFDTQRRQLCVYFQGQTRLELLSSRNCQYDLKPPEYSVSKQEQNPTVRWMKDATKKLKDD